MSTDTITLDLPSTVEETLRECPQFRIVLIGKSGVGKSSLVRAIFNISLKEIDIAHDRPGVSDIDREYTSEDNRRFILHDSEGFEAGSMEKWNKVEKFLRDRSKMDLPDQVHAIWLCIEAPLKGSRVQQAGDEKLLSLAQELRIPVVIVFTKYDYLIKEQRQNANKLSINELERKAEDCFSDRIKKLKASTQTLIVRVSTDETYPRRLETLQELATVTCSCLHDTEVSWVIAQRVNVDQKIETSISEGFKKYWRNLGKSVFFEGHTMEQCVRRIHNDILMVWNFNDPLKLLGEGFFAKVLVFVNPVLVGHENEVPEADGATRGLPQAATTANAAAAIAVAFGASPPIAVAAAAVGVSLLAIKFLYGKYRMMSLNARYLGGYIVHLICILHRLFMETVHMKLPGVLSEELISGALASYEDLISSRPKVHELLSEKYFMLGFENGVRDLITKYTTVSDTDRPGVSQKRRRGIKLDSCIVA